jgi:hypothetical protein
MPFIAPVHGAKVFNSCEEKLQRHVGRCLPSLTESPTGSVSEQWLTVIGVRRRLPRSSSELADVGARPEFTSIESQVRTPHHELTGARRGFSKSGRNTRPKVHDAGNNLRAAAREEVAQILAVIKG